MKERMDIELSIADESVIRTMGNVHLNGIMDIWHRDVIENLGRDMDILVSNRRKYPALSSYKGLSTQITVSNMGSKESSLSTCLVVWYDPYEILYSELLKELGYGEELINRIKPLLDESGDLGSDYEPADNLEKLDWDMIIRRIGFWVLRVKGYMKVVDRDSRVAELETLVNNECRTPPLNRLLKEIGYDYETGLTAIVDDTLAGMKAMDSEPPRRVDRAVNALRLWNLLEVCSVNDEKRINGVLTESFPRIKEAVIRTGELAGKSDILHPDGNLEFIWNFIKENRLPGNWEAVNEIQDLLKTI